MKLRYFFVDPQGQLRKAKKKAIAGLWDGTCRAESLGSPDGGELRLVSVACNNHLIPQRIYLLRVPLTAGRFTEENYLTLQVYTMPDCVTPQEVARHHGGGWPGDLLQQLAVALDVPMLQVRVPVKIGGPLLLAAALRVTPSQAVRFLK